MHSMKESMKDVRKSVNRGLDELEVIADEIRVRLHLGGMDAKDAWKKLEPRLAEAREHAKSASDSSKKAFHDIVKSFEELRAKLK
ncbi:MAG TPA: hypothetical protein VF316_23390 [Polyangiaceae bacterium]